jgi:hypothetical protein
MNDVTVKARQTSGWAVLKMKVEISDWVQAKTKNGELIHGFVDSLDVQAGMATVFAVKSDNSESIGRLVSVREGWLRKLPTHSFEDAESIESLIDIALAAKDEQWFNELSLKLSTLSVTGGEKNRKPHRRISSSNRLGYPV